MSAALPDGVPPFEDQEECPVTGAPHDDQTARVGWSPAYLAWQCQTCGRLDVTETVIPQV